MKNISFSEHRASVPTRNEITSSNGDICHLKSPYSMYFQDILSSFSSDKLDKISWKYIQYDDLAVKLIPFFTDCYYIT